MAHPKKTLYQYELDDPHHQSINHQDSAGIQAVLLITAGRVEWYWYAQRASDASQQTSVRWFEPKSAHVDAFKQHCNICRTGMSETHSNVPRFTIARENRRPFIDCCFSPSQSVHSIGISLAQMRLELAQQLFVTREAGTGSALSTCGANFRQPCPNHE